MTKITFRLPSKAAQYGYAEIEVDHEGDVTGHEVGVMYADLVKSFWDGEKGAKPKAPDAAAVEEFERQLGATKVSEEASESKDEAGSPPWEKPPTASPKPWENKTPDLFG